MEVKQTIDIGRIFDVDLSDRPVLKEKIGQAIIDLIDKRSKSGKDYTGRNFPSYSSGYVGSRDFERYGKSKSKKNMTLTGDMLDAMDILSTKDNEIVIGFDETFASQKAHGNMERKKNKRLFFGVTDSELDTIKENFVGDIAEVETKKSLSDLMFANKVKNGAAANTLNTFIDDLFEGMEGPDYGN